MAIPKYNELYGTFLKAIEDGEVHSVKDIKQSIKQMLNLSEQELLERLQSGILSAIDEMQRNIGKKTFVDKYNEFIQLAASYMTIASPFLPVLGEYLKQSLK